VWGKENGGERLLPLVQALGDFDTAPDTFRQRPKQHEVEMPPVHGLEEFGGG
jgi:hypothetical protein